MAIADVDFAVQSNATATASCTITIPTVAADDLLFVACSSRGASGDPTCTDDDTGGNSWALVKNHAQSTTQRSFVWWKRATSATSAKTITVATADGTSICAGLSVKRGCSTGATPFENATSEANNVAEDDHAAITPTVDGSLVVLCVFCLSNDLVASSLLCTDPGALTTRFLASSTGGSDCAVTWGDALQTTAGPTGAFDWTIGNGTNNTIVFNVLPQASDVTPPTLGTVATNDEGSVITGTLSEAGCTADDASADGTGGFALSGTSATVTDWSISGTTLTLNVATNRISAAETVTISYDRGNTTDDIKDAAGNYLANFSATAVTNNSDAIKFTPSDGSSGGTFTPALVYTTENGDQLEVSTVYDNSAGTYTLSWTNDGGLANPDPVEVTLYAADVTAPTVVSKAIGADGVSVVVVFDEPVNLTTDGWGVTSDGNSNVILSASGSEDLITWTLALTDTVLATSVVTIDYDSDTGDTTDISDNDLASIVAGAVTNESGAGVLTATQTDTTEVTLSWTPTEILNAKIKTQISTDGETWQQVEDDLDDTALGAVVDELNSPIVLEAGETYYFRLEYYDTASGYSTTASLTLIGTGAGVLLESFGFGFGF